MPERRTLYRPVGLKEAELILESGSSGFPPRLPDQPIFYPVLVEEYAVKIAREWNARDAFSGYAGFVTAFDVDAAYLAQFEERVVGAEAVERELWVPAERLAEFNDHIVGPIRFVQAFYGESYSGPAGAVASFADRTAVEQLLLLRAYWWESNFQDMWMTMRVNTAVVQLNYAFWEKHDFSDDGIDDEEKRTVLAEVRRRFVNLQTGEPIPLVAVP
jgi:hypothetical protein